MVSMVEAAHRWASFPGMAAKPPRTTKAQPPKSPSGNTGIERLGSYEELDVRLDHGNGTCWCFMQPGESPSFTPPLLSEMRALQHVFGELFAVSQPGRPPFRFLVVASHIPGIFNLGGDLSLFASLIRAGDRDGLTQYARSCIDVIYHNAVSYDLPIVTIAMVQGNALGGGFEAALSCDVIIAEESAKFGLPEILFNLFPGMGAYSFLSRRVGPHMAEKMIGSGRIYEAEELLRIGVIDLVVKDGEGPAAVKAYVSRHRRRHGAEQALYKVRRRVAPVSYDELRDVSDLWVEVALELAEADLRKMARITNAQRRRWTGPSARDEAEVVQQRAAS